MANMYLLDSNICIHLLRNRSEVINNIRRVGWANCGISEITVIELLYGAECSQQRERNLLEVEEFVKSITVFPLSSCIREFCHQKARLRKSGNMIEDFDLFIGSTAVANGCIMVSENIKHLTHLEGIVLENWIVR